MFLRELFEGSKTAVLAFGRMNPPTIGHKKLADAVAAQPGDPFIFLSQSQKPQTDPLNFATKVKFAQSFFPNVKVGDSSVKTIIQALQKVESMGYDSIIYVAGSDRIEDFTNLINKYNGKEYNFADIKVVSAGERDPDAEGAEGMSASKMRAAAANGDLQSFSQGTPNPKMAQQMYDAVRAGMGISQTTEDTSKKHIPYQDLVARAIHNKQMTFINPNTGQEQSVMNPKHVGNKQKEIEFKYTMGYPLSKQERALLRPWVDINGTKNIMKMPVTKMTLQQLQQWNLLGHPDVPPAMKAQQGAKVNEVTVNYNHLKNMWILRKDAVKGKFFPSSGEVKSIVLQNASPVIDQTAVEKGSRVFAFIQGDKAAGIPNGYKPRALSFKPDEHEPFYHTDDKSAFVNADFVGFNEKGATAFYKQEGTNEMASYKGNIGIMELMKFFSMAKDDPELIKHVKELINDGEDREVWKIVQDYTGTELVGDQFKKQNSIREWISEEFKRLKNLNG